MILLICSGESIPLNDGIIVKTSRRSAVADDSAPLHVHLRSCGWAVGEIRECGRAPA